MPEYTLGLDVGSSSIKASLLELKTGKVIASFTSPTKGEELPIISPVTGWAQQDPNIWWANVRLAVHGLLETSKISADNIKGIGIAYQMHGMTPVDARGEFLMDAIIWCAGRTAEIKRAIEENPALRDSLLEQTLNLPGHFTASKLKWFKDNRPDLYKKLDKALLPGHYILKRATGESTVTASGLSEGVFWNFRDMCLSDLTMQALELERRHIPDVKPTFGEHGRLKEDAANELGLKKDTPVTYLAGDQPNNAFSLNVLNVGDIAAAGGTSAVVYGVTDRLTYDKLTRVNQFLHVNSTTKPNDLKNIRIGILGCVNGAGISNRWARDNLGGGSYDNMNKLAASVAGTEGLVWVPFGNGPERIQQDKNTGAHLIGLDLNRHTKAHVYRAIQEGIVYAMAQAVDCMREIEMPVGCVRACDSGMFKSRLFRQLFADATQAPLELYNTDGSAGAARAAAVGLGLYSLDDAFKGLERTAVIEPSRARWQKAVKTTSQK